MTTPTQPHPATPASAEAVPFKFTHVVYAPLDGTPVLLHMPTTNDGFAVGRWTDGHGGGWTDDDGSFFAHQPVSFMSLDNLRRATVGEVPAAHPPSAERGDIDTQLSIIVKALSGLATLPQTNDQYASDTLDRNAALAVVRHAAEAAGRIRAALAAQPADAQAERLRAARYMEMAEIGMRRRGDAVAAHCERMLSAAREEAARIVAAAQPAAQQGVPVYQYQKADGSWIDQTKASHDYNVQHGQATVRVVYTTPQPAQQVDKKGGEQA